MKPRLHPTRRASPAEVSRIRGQPAFAARRLTSGGRAYETRGPLDALESTPATRASPQPDPLGHLMSRDRGAPEGESGAVRPDATPPKRVWCRASDDPAAQALGLTNERESFELTWPRTTRSRGVPALAKGRGPLHPSLREEGRDRLHPRCLPSKSHPDLRVGLSPWLARRMGPFPQLVTNLWRTRGAVALIGRLTLRPGCLDGRPAA